MSFAARHLVRLACALGALLTPAWADATDVLVTFSGVVGAEGGVNEGTDPVGRSISSLIGHTITGSFSFNGLNIVSVTAGVWGPNIHAYTFIDPVTQKLIPLTLEENVDGVSYMFNGPAVILLSNNQSYNGQNVNAFVIGVGGPGSAPMLGFMRAPGGSFGVFSRNQLFANILDPTSVDIQALGSDFLLYDGQTTFLTGTLTWQQVPASPPSSCQTNAQPDFTSNQGNSLWASDPLNNTVPSANKTKTIGNKGCALTSLGMALNFAGITTLSDSAGTFQNDPGNLNSFMSDTDHDFIESLCKGTTSVCGANVNWGAATADASETTVKFHYANISSEVNFAAATKYLHDQLCNGHPVIVGVKLHDEIIQGVTKRVPGHFVLVTGEDGSDYRIIDPNGGLPGHLFSPPPKTKAFQTRGFVADPPGDLSRLSFAVGDPVELRATDANGNVTGLASNSDDVQAIPQSTYIRDSVDDDVTSAAATETAHILNVDQPSSGVYQLVALGLYAAISEVSVRAFSTDGSSQPPITVPLISAAGSTTTLVVQFSGSPGAISTVTRNASFQSTVADISNSLQLGLIDNPGIANSLVQKIQAASNATGSARGNILNAFENEVRAQSAQHVTGIAPQVFLEDADSLISQIPH